MTITMTLIVAVAGGVGATLRLLVNAAVLRRLRQPFPVAMAFINVAGSFALGVITGLSGVLPLPHHWDVLLGVGLVGGFTAFSTSSFHTLRLLQTGKYWLAVINSIGMLIAAVGLAAVGFWLGSSL